MQYPRIALFILIWSATLVLPMFGAESQALAVGDTNPSSCPANGMAEGFRTYLPDCRAYELVSPPFKDGRPIQAVVGLAADGTHLVGESLGAFAGTESDFSGAYYEMVRSAVGWVRVAISPPQAQFPANEFLAAAGKDPSRTGWALREPSESVYAEDLYVRGSEGIFTKVGPMAPPVVASGPAAGEYQRFAFGNFIRFSGASDDLSHLLFRMRAENVPLWPGDTTVEGVSLYEYVGTGNTHPELVGVSDGGTRVNGETLPSGTLLSDCGTSLGGASLGSGESEETYNAVSADGNVIYFTANGHDSSRCPISAHAPEVTEVYARLGRDQTVPISEPLPRDCGKCSLAPRKPAQFRGASQDGTKAFFLSEQELFPGDETMNLYEYDFSNPQGAKLIRVSEGATDPRVKGVVRVSEDGSHVYFVAEGVLAGENQAHNVPVEGGDNLYAFERDEGHPGGRIAFVGTLAPQDESDWTEFDSHAAQATPDGRFLVFQSAADLTPGDSSTQQQVFEYDSVTETLVRVSVGQAGYAQGSEEADAHAAVITTQTYGAVFAPAEQYKGVAVSANGSTVLFASTGTLTPETEKAAAAGAQSVYEYHSSGSIADGNVYQISSGEDVASGGEPGASALGLDASGVNAFFETAEPLVSQDVDTQFDVYDARTGGGSPVNMGQPPVCESEACGPSQPTQPPRVVYGSALVPGAGSDPTSPVVGVITPTPVLKTSTRTEKLTNALKTCRKMRARRRRHKCEARARTKYSARPKGSKK